MRTGVTGRPRIARAGVPAATPAARHRHGL